MDYLVRLTCFLDDDRAYRGADKNQGAAYGGFAYRDMGIVGFSCSRVGRAGGGCGRRSAC
jgi:hypothetical protein